MIASSYWTMFLKCNAPPSRAELFMNLEDVIETLLGSEIIDENDMVPDMQAYARERWQKRQEKKGSKK